MNNSVRRKSRVETGPTVSKIRRTQRRPFKAALLRGHPFSVDAAELLRRKFLHLAAGAVALPVASHGAWAQAYPARPVRLIVGYPAGGASDIFARLIGQWLSERLGQSFVIENRAGASGTIAVDSVVRARPDGYTLLLSGTPDVYNENLFPDIRFNYIRDISPVASIALNPLVMEVNPSFPAKTVPEFIDYAKAKPGKINFASSGIGTTPHLYGELFKMMTGVTMVHVPYRGDLPAITDLLAGQVQVYFGSLTASIEYVKAGNLRALAVTSTTRSPGLPDIAAMGEFLPGLEANAWFGIGAPKNTPAGIIDKLNRDINAALGDPRIKARFAHLGAVVFPSSTAEFAKLISADTEKWLKVIRAANIKL
jgi:tripartite-type tricarboxylate transporter receptor subunit TctC